jgi:DNA-binding NtrC family response regulator
LKISSGGDFYHDHAEPAVGNLSHEVQVIMRLSFDRNYIRPEMPIPTNKTHAVAGNKLEALKLLADLILAEVETLERARNLSDGDDINLAREVERFESDIIRCALVRTGGRQRKAARLLNIKPTTLHAKLKRYGILQDHSNDPEDTDENRLRLVK